MDTDPFDGSSSDPLEHKIRAAVLALLGRIPETWAHSNPDSLTQVEIQALTLLVAAGVVERRMRLRCRILNHPSAVEATLTVTGEFGIELALDALAAAAWGKWESSYDDWKKGDAAASPAFHCETLDPQEWRLTDQGVVALEDLKAGETRMVLDFVTRRGAFTTRPLVRGEGRLVAINWQSGETPPVPARVVNWEEGAQILKALFEQLLALPPQRPNVPTEPDENQPESTTSSGYASSSAPIPAEYVSDKGPNGPLEGHQRELAWAVDPRPGREPRTRQLKPLHRSRVFVRQISPKKVEVYFRNPKALADAQQALADYRANPAIWKKACPRDERTPPPPASP